MIKCAIGFVMSNFCELQVCVSSDMTHSSILERVLSQPILTWLAMLSCNCWLNDFNATRLQIKKQNFGSFVLMVPFEILLHYPNIDISYWLKKDVQWIV